MQDLFVSLGAGVHQIPLIEAARAMGYMVVAVDKNLDAPGFEYAHERIQRSILRPASIRRKLEAIAGDPVAIVARSYGKALISSAALSDHLGLQGPGVQAVRFFQNKSAYKSILEDAGILVPRRFQASQIARIKKDMRLIARPVAGHGKLGIEILETRKDRTRFASGQEEGWLIEELVSGTEVTVLGASHRGSYRTLLLTSKRISQSPPHFAEIMHRYPALISPQTKEKINQICAKIVEVSGLRTSPLVSEFIVTEDESIYLVESAPETGGEFLADFAFSTATGTDYFKWFIRLLTEDSMPELNLADRAAVIRYLMPAEGQLIGLEFPKWLKSCKEFAFEKKLIAPGTRTDLKHGNLHRLAAIGLRGGTSEIETLITLADKAAQETNIEYKSA